MTITNSIEVKQEELNLVKRKLNELEKTKQQLQERGLMIIGAIEALQEQVKINELTAQAEESNDDE